jgi:alpha-D-xyloside xylohydrolase
MKKMTQRRKLWILLLLFAVVLQAAGEQRKELGAGVICITAGTPDRLTPYGFCGEQPQSEALKALGDGSLPFEINKILIEKTSRGYRVAVPLADDEKLYGLGLQAQSFELRGKKKRPIVNDTPMDIGFTHAPEPFYVSNKGYGILVNTLRYTTFYFGTLQQKEQQGNVSEGNNQVETSTDKLYANKMVGNAVWIDIPGCQGVEVIVFKGPDLKTAIARYNLLGGGGCLPPMWGLGLKYRVKGDFNQNEVMQMSRYFRDKRIPCDVLGLEPGWQTQAYSCSYLWNKERFPNHTAMLDDLSVRGFKVNLWEHAFVHPSSPLYEPLKQLSADFKVWNGLVPDFALPETRKRFSDYHRTLVQEGVAAFKLDECDNSNIASSEHSWSFPELSEFPSGLSGEEMHQAFGLLYLKTLSEMFKEENRRTYMDYRSSGLFASSMPGCLYSDSYTHSEYIRMLTNEAFAGLLWCPEVRTANNEKDFFRRLQTVLLSPDAMINSWFLRFPPWLQYDRDKNNKGEFLADSTNMENISRKLIEQRMALIPYLYAAFAKYHFNGIPPFRPLVFDFAEDEKVTTLDDEYLIGDDLLAAPFTEEQTKRKVYLPRGLWYNFHTHEKYEGGKYYEVEFGLDQLPLFVRDGTLLPLAEPVQMVMPETVFYLQCVAFGKAVRAAELFEDDGVSYNFEKGSFNQLSLSVEKGKVRMNRTGTYRQKRYVVKGVTFVDR